MRAERVKPAPAKDRNGKSEKWHVKSDRPGFRGLWLVCFGDGRATKRRRNRRRRPLSPGSEGLAADKAVPSGPADRAGGQPTRGLCTRVRCPNRKLCPTTGCSPPIRAVCSCGSSGGSAACSGHRARRLVYPAGPRITDVPVRASLARLIRFVLGTPTNS